MKRLLIVLLLLPVLAEAKKLYLSPTGSDAVTYGNNDITHPWLTPGKLLTTIQVGDTARCRDGNYTVSSTIDNRTTGNNGTKANPIVIMAYEGETCTWTAGSQTLNPVIELERPYYTFHAIKFVSGYQPLRIAQNSSSPRNGTLIDSCSFTLDYGNDNQAAITLNIRSDSTIIRYCRFIGPGTSVDAPRYRTTAVIAFQTKVWAFYFNYVTDMLFGVFQKHGNVTASNGVSDPQPATRANSLIYWYGNLITGSIQSCLKFSGRFGIIRNNICGDGVSGASSLSMGEDGGFPGGDSTVVTHNTFMNLVELLPDSGTAGSQGGVTPDDLPGSKGNTLRDNIYRGRFDVHALSNRTHFTTTDYNLFYSASATDCVRNNSLTYTKAAWVTFYGQDAHSLAGAPIFAGGSTPTALTDYVLSLGSLGKGTASDGGDMGAMNDSVGDRAGLGGGSCLD